MLNAPEISHVQGTRIYLAGPMRSLPDWNFPAFDRARKALQGAGFVVYCPAQLCRALPYGNEQGTGEPGQNGSHEHLRHVLMVDLACIMQAQALYLLPGWEGSRGASFEVAAAQFLGLPLFCAESWQRLNVPLQPWGLLRDLLPGFAE